MTLLPSLLPKSGGVVFYDGECGVCNAAINFIWKRDLEGEVFFASLQSEWAGAFLRDLGIVDIRFDTMYFFRNGVIYERSDAVVQVLQSLPRCRFFGGIIRTIPAWIRIFFYDVVADNRYKLSKKTACELPPAEVRERFIP